MKKLLLAAILAVSFGCDKTEAKSPITPPTTVITQGLRFCEGSVAHGSSLLVSNFGTTELNPLNTEGKGYIVKLTGNKAEVFIPADGNLSAPKGMAIGGDYLYIADVGKVVVYHLGTTPVFQMSIQLPEGNLFVNDIVVSGNFAYISVTNTGKIFKLDISNPANLTPAKLSLYVDVTGANGLLLNDKSLYIASYPADGNTTAENVIYKIADIGSPVVEKLFTCEGQYDGLAIKGNKLFFTNWVGPEIGYINLNNNQVTILPITGATLTGPADISLTGDKLYIPNLPSSEVIEIDTKNL